MDALSLATVCGGAVQEKVNEVAKQVFENLQDPNTPWKNKRSITVTISFQQNEDRDDLSVGVQVVSKLAPVSPLETRMAIGKDLRTGEVYAEEYGKQIRGQMSLSDYENRAETIVGNDVIDTDTGEVVGKVTDFRRAQEA